MSDARDRAASVRRYVFFEEQRPSRAWMPTLDVINDRFSQNLRSALVEHLRPGVEVTPPIAIKMVKHGELMEQLTVPSYLTLVKFSPLRGMILVVGDAHLVSWIVESRFGGDGRFPLKIADREFSAFEQNAMRRVMETALDQLALAWKPIGAFAPEIVRHETQPQFAGIAAADELIIVSSFDVKFGRGGGKFTVCMPYALLEPLHDQLIAGIVKRTIDHDRNWSEALTIGIEQAGIVLNVELAQIELTVRDLVQLRPGHVFEIDRPDWVTVKGDGLPLFRARWGRCGRRIGVRIEERLIPAADLLASARSGATVDGHDYE
jgi:flagellar motor switch protein FliM